MDLSNIQAPVCSISSRQRPFSVVVPTYNCGCKLAATIESVMLQPRELYELIVVDGGSTDDTLMVIEKYGGSLKFISEADRGVYDALNKGIHLSSGKHLVFLGAGDSLRAGVLERVAADLPGEGGPSFVYGGAYFARHNLFQRGPFNMKDFATRNICHQAIFYERTIFDALGGFDLKYKIYADWAFNMKCFADQRIRKVYLDMIVADFEGGGISEMQTDVRFKKDLPRLIRKYLGWDEYLRHRIYCGRVSFYLFRHALADSIKTVARQLTLTLRQRKSNEVKKNANPGCDEFNAPEVKARSLSQT